VRAPGPIYGLAVSPGPQPTPSPARRPFTQVRWRREDGVGDANSDDEHDPEGATIAFERQRTSALRAQAEAHLDDVDRARARLAAGSYGICRSCRRPISTERLTALPVTEMCMDCARFKSGCS
jgi:DnaK suppressor protein